MSSATRITSGFAFAPSAISGRNPQAEAENEASLFDIPARGPARALNCEVESSAIASKRHSQPPHERGLRNLLAVEPERERPESRASAHDDESLHHARS